MTTPALPTFQDGVLVDAADLNAIGANIVALYQAAMGGASGSPGYQTVTKPQVVLRVTATRTVARNTEVAVIWDVADVNTDAMWVSGATITVNTAGTYRLSAQAGFDGVFNDGTGIQLYLCINGTVTSTNTFGCWREDQSPLARASATVSLLPGSTIIVIGQHASSSTRHWLTTTSGCRFEAIRIGPA